MSWVFAQDQTHCVLGWGWWAAAPHAGIGLCGSRAVPVCAPMAGKRGSPLEVTPSSQCKCGQPRSGDVGHGDLAGMLLWGPLGSQLEDEWECGGVLGRREGGRVGRHLSIHFLVHKLSVNCQTCRWALASRELQALGPCYVVAEWLSLGNVVGITLVQGLSIANVLCAKNTAPGLHNFSLQGSSPLLWDWFYTGVPLLTTTALHEASESTDRFFFFLGKKEIFSAPLVMSLHGISCLCGPRPFQCKNSGVNIHLKDIK